MSASALPVGPSGSAKSAMSGSVGASLDDVEGAVAPARRQRSGRLRRLLEALARPEHVAEPEDQEERDAGEDNDLDHLRAHRANLLVFPPQAMAARGCRPYVGLGGTESIGPALKRGRGMALWLFLIFVGLPILEIALFVEIGGAIGLLATLAIIVLTAILGVGIMRWQGLRALDRLRASVETGGDPVGPIAHGALDPGRGNAPRPARFLHRLPWPPPAHPAGARPSDPAGRLADDGAGGDLRAAPRRPRRGPGGRRRRSRRTTRWSSPAPAPGDAPAGPGHIERARCGPRGGVLDRALKRDDGRRTHGRRDERRGGRCSAQPRLQILTQYVRDLSFENIAAQKGVGIGRPSPISGCR